MSRKTVLVVNDIRDCGETYYKPFSQFGRYETDPDLLRHRPRDVALVVFTGGSDVTPSIYGESKSPRCGWTHLERDEHEKQIFEWAKSLEIPMAGICRGSQLLCALNGGTLYQHITGHHGVHQMLTHDGRKFMVSSTHHQMANPYSLLKAEGEPKVKVLAWAYPKLSNVYFLGSHQTKGPDIEYEVIYYPESNSIGFQYHPEIMDEESEGFKYATEMCIKHLGLNPTI